MIRLSKGSDDDVRGVCKEYWRNALESARLCMRLSVVYIGSIGGMRWRMPECMRLSEVYYEIVSNGECESS